MPRLRRGVVHRQRHGSAHRRRGGAIASLKPGEKVLAANTRTGKTRACGGYRSQHWVARCDGSLVDTLSGTCLADPGGITEDFTQLEISTCKNGTFWSWGLP